MSWPSAATACPTLLFARNLGMSPATVMAMAIVGRDGEVATRLLLLALLCLPGSAADRGDDHRGLPRRKVATVIFADATDQFRIKITGSQRRSSFLTDR